MKKLILLHIYIPFLTFLILPLHAFYIDNELGNTIHSDSVKIAWSNAGYFGGVENFIDPVIEYDITSLPSEWVGHSPYNAVNADSNSTDNFYAFSRAIRILDSLFIQAKTLKIPRGKYNIVGTLLLNTNLIIKGAGSGKTTLNFIIPENPNWTPHCLNAFEMIEVDHTGIEDLTIQRYITSGTEDMHDFLLEDGHGGMDNSNNILMRKSDQCWITGVESIEPLRHHVEIDSCNNITISGCYFNDVRIRSGGGFGYGVQFINGSNQCLIENNIDEVRIAPCVYPLKATPMFNWWIGHILYDAINSFAPS